MRILRILWAHVAANVYAGVTLQCVHVRVCIGPRWWNRRTTHISVGRGSVVSGTWKERRVFYHDDRE